MTKKQKAQTAIKLAFQLLKEYAIENGYATEQQLKNATIGIDLETLSENVTFGITTNENECYDIRL